MQTQVRHRRWDTGELVFAVRVTGRSQNEWNTLITYEVLTISWTHSLVHWLTYDHVDATQQWPRPRRRATWSLEVFIEISFDHSECITDTIDDETDEERRHDDHPAPSPVRSTRRLVGTTPAMTHRIHFFVVHSFIEVFQPIGVSHRVTWLHWKYSGQGRNKVQSLPKASL